MVSRIKVFPLNFSLKTFLLVVENVCGPFETQSYPGKSECDTSGNNFVYDVVPIIPSRLDPDSLVALKHIQLIERC